jgi:tyrosyl-tRNA synthetase
MLKEGSISINKTKIDENYSVTENDLLNKLYILVQKGKKNYYLVKTQ